MHRQILLEDVGEADEEFFEGGHLRLLYRIQSGGVSEFRIGGQGDFGNIDAPVFSGRRYVRSTASTWESRRSMRWMRYSRRIRRDTRISSPDLIIATWCGKWKRLRA